MATNETVRLGGATRLAYGLGLAAEGVKQNTFQVFLLFFYQQIVGLDPVLAGLALFLSLMIDAVADPAIGVWSDGFRSKLGRRHPFMYAAIIPVALCFYAVFSPPGGMSQIAKFLWLLVFAVGTRFSLALFVIPHQSLVPELTNDTDQRSRLVALRTVFAWMFGLATAFCAFTIFFAKTAEYPYGLLNPAGYPKLALFGTLTMVVALTISALGTQRAALAAHAVTKPITHVTLTQLPKQMARALRAKSYRSAVIAGLFLYVAFGLTENLRNYVNTFFWGFSAEQIGRFIIVIFFASLVVLSVARPLIRRFGNRRVGIGAALVITLLDPLLIAARLAGLLPDPGDPLLFKVISVAVFFGFSALILGMTVVGTMITDTTDEHELDTGARQEGLLFSASMFISKAASGIGTLGSGLVIKAAGFPVGAKPGMVDPDIVRGLGAGTALAGLVLGAFTVYWFSRYTLSHERHAGIVAELQTRRTARVA